MYLSHLIEVKYLFHYIQDQITLPVTESKVCKEIAQKLQWPFGHPSTEKIIKLIKNAGPQWSENKELQTEIKKVC